MPVTSSFMECGTIFNAIEETALFESYPNEKSGFLLKIAF